MVAHMGILFLKEKHKKVTLNHLYTSANALQFGVDSPPSFESSRKLDGFEFEGVVLTIIATQPLDIYHGSQGYNLQSKESYQSYPFAIDIISYHFVSEFEPSPKLSIIPEECIFNMNDEEIPIIGNDRDVDFLYSNELFNPDDSYFLLQGFEITLYNEDVSYVFRVNEGNLILVKVDNDNNEEIINQNVQFNDIRFLEKSFFVGDLEFGPIDRVKLVKYNL